MNRAGDPVGGLEHDFYFSIYWDILGIIIIPTDFHIFQRGLFNHQPVIDVERTMIFFVRGEVVLSIEESSLASAFLPRLVDLVKSFCGSGV